MQAVGVMRNTFRRIWFLFWGTQTLAWKALTRLSLLALVMGPQAGLLPLLAMRATACLGLVSENREVMIRGVRGRMIPSYSMVLWMVLAIQETAMYFPPMSCQALK
jgi:hypothetical protein